MTIALPARPDTVPVTPAVVTSPLVPLMTGRTVRYANLDLAASAPPLRAVADHMAELLPHYASVHRGAGYASQVSTAVLERARGTVGRFLGARPDDVVVFTRNTTDALNLLARAVPGTVLCLDAEHHANLLPWTGGPHRVLPAASTITRTLDDLRAALAAEPVALVAVTGAGNVTGELLPLAGIAALAHAAGARLAVDAAAQLAPHRRIDLATAGSTTSPCPGTSSTPPTAPACWSGDGTGSTRPRRTSPAAARAATSPPAAAPPTSSGPRPRSATRAAPRTCWAPRRPRGRAAPWTP